MIAPGQTFVICLNQMIPFLLVIHVNPFPADFLSPDALPNGIIFKSSKKLLKLDSSVIYNDWNDVIHRSNGQVLYPFFLLI